MVEDYFISFDKLRLFYRYITSEGFRVCLVLVHGLGEHSGRYINFFQRFSGLGYSVYALDLRGHGRSQGRRGHIMAFSDYLKDIKLFMEFVGNMSKSKYYFMVSHSMGGLIAVRYAQEYGTQGETGLSGLIVSSPLLKIRVQVPKIKMLLGRAVSRFIPWLSMSNELDPAFLSHDTSVVHAYIQDPLVHTKVTARWFTEIIKSMRQSFENACNLTIPCLFLHAGDDHLADPEGTRSLFPLIASKDKELKVYEGFYHELFNEPRKEQVFSDIEGWLRRVIQS